MTPETEKALRESISHWERMRDGKNGKAEGITGYSCALCLMFWSEDGKREDADSPVIHCMNCPVRSRTGKDECAGTPYGEAARAHYDYGKNSIKFRIAAQAEINFLKSLLPVCADVPTGDA